MESEPPSVVVFNFRKRSRGKPAPTWILDTKKPTVVGLFLSLFYHLRRSGGRRRIRTSDRLVRSQVLYPAELCVRYECIVFQLLYI